MNEDRAKELNHEILRKIRSLLKKEHYETIFINLGRDYLPAIHVLENIIPKDTKLCYARGRVGERIGR